MIVTSWILVVVFSTNGGDTYEMQKFNSRGACVQAASFIKKSIVKNRRVQMTCIMDEKQTY